MAFNRDQAAEVPKINRPPHIGEIAAAKLFIKRVEEGKSDDEITPMIRWIAAQDPLGA